MSTRSCIGVELDDKLVLAVGCHFDGYLEGIGEKLLLYYDDIASALFLVEEGEISSLGDELASSEFYCRDRGEEWNSVKYQIFENKNDYLTRAHDCFDFPEYIYLFRDGDWYVKYDMIKKEMKVERALFIEEQKRNLEHDDNNRRRS